MALLSGWTSTDLQDEISNFITRSSTRFDGTFWSKTQWSLAYEDILNQAISGGISKGSDLDNRCSARSANVSHSSVDENSAVLSGDVYGHDDDAYGNLLWRFAVDTDSAFGSPSYYPSSSGNSISVYSITGANAVSITAGSLSDSTTYYYRLEVKNPWQDNWNTGQRSQVGSSSFATAVPNSCESPRNFSAGLGFNNVIDLSWNDPLGNNQDGFNIEYEVNGGSRQSLVNLSATANSYTHDGFGTDYDNGDSVEYFLYATCPDPNSPFSVQSDPVTATVLVG